MTYKEYELCKLLEALILVRTSICYTYEYDNVVDDYFDSTIDRLIEKIDSKLNMK